MAANLLDENGYTQLQRAIAERRAANAVQAAPVGPPALLAAPPVPQLTPGVRVNPTNTTLAQEGALRPPAGPFSASNPQPQVDASGSLVPATPRPVGVAPIAPVTTAAQPAVPAAPPVPAIPSTGVVAGVDTTAPTQATSINGRPLRYGAMQDGVRVFSDGSGGPGAPPATMTRAQIDSLGARVNRADAGIGGGIGTEAYGGTPPLGAFTGDLTATPTRPGANPVAAARAAQIGAQMDAASDAASIASRDPRSVLGSAARNADVEAGSGFGSPAERAAAHQQALDALNGVATSGIDQTGKISNDNFRFEGERVQDSGATARNAATNAADITKEIIAKRPEPKDVTLADGTLGLLGADGVLRPARNPDGSPVRPQVGKPAEDIASLNKSTDEVAKSLLGVDPVSGKIPTADGKGRTATAAEYQQAYAAAREVVRPSASSAPPRPQSKDAFMAAARAANPGVPTEALESYYKKTYGS